MNRFFKDLKCYGEYVLFAGYSQLKAEVSGSFLTWLWWILDPFLHMMVYAFISLIVFNRSEPHFIPFVFVGQCMWKFINSSLTGSVKMVRANKSVLSRIYLPKTMLLLSNMYSFFIQLMITLAITVVMCILDRVTFTWHILWTPFIVALLFLGTYGISCIFLHVGVYVKDMGNVIGIVLKLAFYMSGVFYSIPLRVPAPYGQWLLCVNPAASLINELRNVLVYGQAPDVLMLGIWLVISLLLCYIGIRLICKHEQNYIKAV
ncbi:MAG: ABC transporter permease [Clostridia bacterium]|nr:ABC transporter permease [Clostridia bacterium]